MFLKMIAKIIYLVCCLVIVQASKHIWLTKDVKGSSEFDLQFPTEDEACFAIRDQEKFKEEMQPTFQKCADETGYSKEDGERLVWSTHVPDDEEAKCFLACYYEKIEATKDGKFWMKGKTNMNVYTEILRCLGTGAEGQDPCELASDIRICFNQYIATGLWFDVVRTVISGTTLNEPHLYFNTEAAIKRNHEGLSDY